MARQKVPIDQPDRLVFPPGAHIKITNTGSQIVYIADTPDALFQIDFVSNTPIQGMPLSPDKTETWWGPEGLWVRCAIPGGEIESSFSIPNVGDSATPSIGLGALQPSRFQPGYVRKELPVSEYTTALLPVALRGKIAPR
jgi:hypothetical protein